MIARRPFRYLVVSLVIGGSLATSAFGQSVRSVPLRVNLTYGSPVLGYGYYPSLPAPPTVCIVRPWGVYCGPSGPYSYNPYDYRPYSYYGPYSFYGPYSYLPYRYGPYGYPYSYGPYGYGPYFYGPSSGMGCPLTVPPSACRGYW
jgi:hypothetical protein